MKTFIIATYDKTEFDTLSSKLDIKIELLDDNKFGKIIVENASNRIIIFSGPQDDPEILKNELINSINLIDNPKIVLVHRIMDGIDWNFNVSTVSDKDDRTQYEKLLHSNSGGIINWKHVNDVWDYFTQKNTHETIDRCKSDFLNYIYNGGKPSVFLSKNKIPNVELLNNLYEVFDKDDALYDLLKDCDDDENKGAEQRRKLILLRDKLFINE
jgi:hypothetical protein